jgi:hypothetical protein
MPTPSTELYRKIVLTQGQVAIVDASDFDWLNQWKWCAHWAPNTKSYYATRTAYKGRRNKRTVWMHRVILGLDSNSPCKGDHANRNTLDNRKENLRIADTFQNAQNATIRSDNTSGQKGVY